MLLFNGIFSLFYLGMFALLELCLACLGNIGLLDCWMFMCLNIDCFFRIIVCGISVSLFYVCMFLFDVFVY